jgi:hypothetical protein
VCVSECVSVKERERGENRERERKKELVLQFYTGRYYLRERCGCVFMCVGVLVTLYVCKCVCKGIQFFML